MLCIVSKPFEVFFPSEKVFKILPCKYYRSKFLLDSLDSTKKTSGVIPKKNC